MAVPQEILDRSIPSIPDFKPAVFKADVQDATERAQNWLLKEQAEDGYWLGELEGDSILESEYILLLTFLGLEKHRKKIEALARYLLKKQEKHGGWSIYPGGPPDISGSVKAYFALKLAGYDPALPFMEKAKNLIVSLGGINKTNSFTKIYLAMLGQFPWKKCPAIPPEGNLLPPYFYINMYATSAWSRTIVVPLSVLWAFRPVISTPVQIDELLVADATSPHDTWDKAILTWKNAFLALDWILKWIEKLKINAPFRKWALRTAERWMIQHFRRSDGLGAIFPPMVNAVIAMKLLGYSEDHPYFLQAMWQLEALEIEEEGTIRMQPCLSPVWDTALAVTALHESGVPSANPALIKAAEWLVSKEVKEPGDWKITNPDLPAGGWVFEFNNEFYPDVDDTAMVLIALSRVDLASKRPAVSRGIKWLLGMQGKDGGWAAFDRDNNHEILTNVPFADHNAMLDPSCPDLTGRVLEMLSAYGYTTKSPAVVKAIDFVKENQELDGSWYGRWGVNYIYGTWQVLKGLASIGEKMNSDYVKRAAEWLRSVQNPDGGWGESCESYNRPALKGIGESTPSQTAWALMGLLAAGDYESLSVKDGFRWLLNHQTSGGTWEEEIFTGTGFPKVFYLRYHLYRHYFPLFAFGMYQKKQKAKEA